MDRKNDKDLQELYAAWGTTREKHKTQMLALIEQLNAEVEKELKQATTQGVKVRMAEPAHRRAAAPKPAAATGKIALIKQTRIENRFKYRADKEKESAVAGIAAESKIICSDTLGIKTISVRGQHVRSTKGRRRR